MAVLFILLALLTMFHFIYESTLAPSLRLELRYRLFELRDNLRNLRIQQNIEISDEVFQQLEYSLGSTIKHLSHINFSLLLEAKKEFESNKHLRRQVERKVQLINTCETAEIQEIVKKANACAIRSFFLNTGFWMIYLLPIILVVRFISELKKGIQKAVFYAGTPSL